MFTVKMLFEKVTLTEDLLAKHRGYFGSHLRDVYKQSTGMIPEKVLVDEMLVNHYPDTYRLDAEDLLDWYHKQFILAEKKVKPAQTEQLPEKKKRKRIAMAAYKTNLNN